MAARLHVDAVKRPKKVAQVNYKQSSSFASSAKAAFKGEASATFPEEDSGESEDIQEEIHSSEIQEIRGKSNILKGGIYDGKTII